MARRDRWAPAGPTRSAAGPWLRIALHRQPPDLGAQLLDLALPLGLSVPANSGVEGASRLLPQLLLPRLNLVRVDFLSLRQVRATLDCSRTAPGAVLAFGAASIFRLGFFIIRSV